MLQSGYITNSTNICNYPVQALATAEIIPIGLVYFWHYVRAAGLQMQLVNTVHDSVIAELPPEEVAAFHVLARICLVDEVYPYLRCMYNVDFTVPLAAGVQTGTHWSSDNGKKPTEYVYSAQEDQYRS